MGRSSQAGITGEVLTNEQQYALEMQHVSSLTEEEEQVYLARARQGDSQAREALILSCLRYVNYLAWKYAKRGRLHSHRVEYLDLVAVGNVTLVEVFDKALAHPCPIGYLKKSACGMIQNYCERQCESSHEVGNLHAAIFRHPKSGDDLFLVDVLPAPELTSTPTRDFTPLFTALEQLPPLQQEVIKRHYGLDGAPESILSIECDIRQRQGKPPVTVDTGTIRGHGDRGIARLKAMLHCPTHEQPEYIMQGYTVKQACTRLQVSTATLRRLVVEQGIRRIQQGTYAKEDVDRVARQRALSTSEKDADQRRQAVG